MVNAQCGEGYHGLCAAFQFFLPPSLKTASAVLACRKGRRQPLRPRPSHRCGKCICSVPTAPWYGYIRIACRTGGAGKAAAAELPVQKSPPHTSLSVACTAAFSFLERDNTGIQRNQRPYSPWFIPLWLNSP